MSKLHLNQVGRVAVTVADTDRAIGFYVDTLGFEKIVDVPMGDPNMRWVEVQLPGSITSIALAPPPPGTRITQRSSPPASTSIPRSPAGATRCRRCSGSATRTRTRSASSSRRRSQPTVMVIQTSGGISGLPGTGRRSSRASSPPTSAATRRQKRAAATFASWNGISQLPG
jgi:catechol 2,3-dioxygenase-like lactoylglutathione lyase family enzyme